MATIKKRECPREVFIRENIKAADNKFSKLRSIMKHTIMQIDIATTTVADVKQIVGNEFEALNQEHMLPFEAEDEEKRMSFLINRWLSFEKKRLPQGRILAKNFQSTFLFAGTQKTTTVHMLIERENVIFGSNTKRQNITIMHVRKTPDLKVPKNCFCYKKQEKQNCRSLG